MKRASRLSEEDQRAASETALEAAGELDRRFGFGVIKLVLRGSKSRKVIDAGLDSSSVYGALARMSANQVDEVLAGLVSEGLLETSPGPYPVAMLTEEGRLQLDR